jgi:hypothetical protein
MAREADHAADAVGQAGAIDRVVTDREERLRAAASKCRAMKLW